MAAWLLPALAAGASVASSIFGGSKASKSAKKANALIDSSRAANQAWYNKRYNEDYSQTAEAQNAMNYAKQTLDDEYQKIAATSAVSGATGTAQAQQKAQANKALAEAASGIAASGSAYKSSVESQYLQNDNAFAQQQSNTLMGQASNISNAAGQASNTFSQLATILAQNKKSTGSTTAAS